MVKGLVVAVSVAMLGVAAPAFAQGLGGGGAGGGGGGSSAPATTVSRVTVEQLAKVLQDAGYRAEIVRGERRPFIRTGLSGRRATIYMYDCKDANCGSFQFSVIFNKDSKFTVDFSNAWNTKRRYSKTYIDSDGDMNLEWDIDMDGGVTNDFLKQAVFSFERFIAEFDKFQP